MFSYSEDGLYAIMDHIAEWSVCINGAYNDGKLGYEHYRYVVYIGLAAATLVHIPVKIFQKQIHTCTWIDLAKS